MQNPEGGFYHGNSGKKLSSIHNQARTVLVADQPAIFAYSWHQPEGLTDPGPNELNDQWNVSSFMDGHASYIKFYYDDTRPTFPCFYNPPDNYEYQWGED